MYTRVLKKVLKRIEQRMGHCSGDGGGTGHCS